MRPAWTTYDHVREMNEYSDGAEDEGGVENEEDEDLLFSEQEKVGWPENKVLVESKTIRPIRNN